MKLELPDNNASVLFHMGNALQSIAGDLDATYTQNPDKVWELVNSGHEVTRTEIVGDVNQSVTVEPTTTMFKGVGSVDAGTDADDVDPIIEISNTIDADGLPWDQRIHSGGKTRLDDNTWRMARKPKDKTDEEWAEYVEGVKTELRALMAIPVTVTYDPNEADPFAIDAVDVSGVEFKRLPGVIREVEIHGTIVTPPVVDAVVTPPVVDTVVALPVVDTVVTPPVVDAVVTPPVVDAVVPPPVDDAVVPLPVVDAVVTPPVADAVVTPPVIDTVVTTGPTTFPELMKFITVNNKKLTKESVDEALKAQGLASIALLAARTDLIPQVHAALVKLL